MSDLYIPADPGSVVLSPVKGMYRNFASHRLPDGGVWTAKNFIIGERGPKRSPGFEYFGGSGGTGKGLPLRGLVTFWNTSGNQILVAFDDKYLYTVSNSSFTIINSTYNTGTLSGSIGASILTGASSVWDTAGANVAPGDLIYVDPAGNNDLYEITAVSSGTQISVTPSLVRNYGAGTAYIIYRRFSVTDPYLLDWTIIDNKMVMTEQSRIPWSYDGATLGAYDSTDVTFKATCCLYFKDRLWFGDILDGATRYRQRIKWSETLDHTSFPADYYLDRPYMSGALKRLIGMGDNIVSFYDDAVEIGRPTNLVNPPYSFKAIETGGIGLTGMRAVCSFVGGIFFIGQDNIYMLSNRGLEMIGTPIVSETIRKASGLQYAYAGPDPENDRIVFGFPEAGQYMSKIWSWNYKSQQWSYEEIGASMLALTGLTPALEWNDMSSAGEAALPADNWNVGMAKYPGWDAIGQAIVSGTFHLGTTSGQLWRASPATTTTPDGSPIPALLETGDFDLKNPNGEKTWLRASIKIDTFLNSNLVFKVEVSGNRGRTWKVVADSATGNGMTIEAGEDEGYVDFKLSSSTCRIRLSSSSQVEEYSITEVVIDYFQSGSQERHLEPVAAS